MRKLPSKGPIPDCLRNFCRENPGCKDWDSFRDNNPDSYRELKRAIFTQQSFLCSYCEENLPEDDSSKQRIEHFHPKSDQTAENNWTFDWNNMLGVCLGGSREHPIELHCDASKERNVTTDTCEGFMLNPLNMPEECLFMVDRSTGKLLADENICLRTTVANNHFSTVRELVDNTIKILNLNCDRLNKKRKKVIAEYEKMRKDLRLKHFKGSIRTEIARRWFEHNIPSFFTTRRFLLGQFAEQFIGN